MPARRIAGRIYEEIAVRAVDPLPVDIQGATLSLDANGVEIKNDSGNPIPISDAGGSITVDGSSLSSIAGLGIPAHDNLLITYRTTGNGTGKIDQVAYKTGGTTVGTLTLVYDASNRLSTVTKS